MKLKIDPEMRHQNLAQHVKFQLSFISVEDVRLSVTAFVLMYDLPLLLGLSGIKEMAFLWLALPFIIIINLWGARLIIKNPYGTQFEMILFMGVWGLLGSISLMVTVEGMSYYMLQITSLFYYIIINAASILLAYILVKYQIVKYAGDPTKERKKGNQSKYMGVLAIAPAIGYMLEQSTRGTGVLEHVITLIVIYMFAVFLVYGAAKFLHRYFFMRANMAYVNYHPRSSKEKKKLMKQGVEIK